MKKLISLCITLCILIALSASAFAEIYYNGIAQHFSDLTAEAILESVKTDESGDVLTVLGDVTGGYDDSVTAVNGSEIHVLSGIRGDGNVSTDDDLSRSDSRTAVVADDSLVEIEGAVTASLACDAGIEASGGASVTAGSVVCKGDLPDCYSGDPDLLLDTRGVYASGNGTEVQILGDVSAVVLKGTAIVADNGATVIVGGDAEGTAKCVDGAPNSVVIIEGTASGEISTDGVCYVGALDSEQVAPMNTFYLIALKDGVDISSDVLSGGTVDGIEKTYAHTTSLNSSDLYDRIITLSSTQTGKGLTVTGTLPDVIESSENDGKIILTIRGDYRGGLQNLDELIGFIPLPNYPAPSGGEVYVLIVPAYTMETLSVTGNATKLAMNNNHSGVTLPAGSAGADIRVFFNGAELPADAFSIYTHSDGSVSVILSNTYLLTLDAGVYEFTVTAGSEVITFSVLVS